jgi:hypothetical protein
MKIPLSIYVTLFDCLLISLALLVRFQCVAIDPLYKSRQAKLVVYGGPDTQLQLNTKGWLISKSQVTAAC